MLIILIFQPFGAVLYLILGRRLITRKEKYDYLLVKLSSLKFGWSRIIHYINNFYCNEVKDGLYLDFLKFFIRAFLYSKEKRGKRSEKDLPALPALSVPLFTKSSFAIFSLCARMIISWSG